MGAREWMWCFVCKKGSRLWQGNSSVCCCTGEGQRARGMWQSQVPSWTCRRMHPCMGVRSCLSTKSRRPGLNKKACKRGVSASVVYATR